MTKRISRLFLITAFLAGFREQLSAQTLFTYGNQSVSKAAFLKAYQKNNTNKKPGAQSYREYLNLYTRYKLKVKAALDERMDTLPGQVAELKNFRAQIADSYIRDNQSLDKLVNEAFSRSQKDIHLAHIFIANARTGHAADSIKAFQKASAALDALKSGTAFRDVALKYSEDLSALKNGGDIGYITVFVLPYDLETLAYQTPPGQYSGLLHDKGGYHIFKNLEERPAAGKMKAAQILFAFPPYPGDSIRIAVKHKADSIYTLLTKGGDFADLAKRFSSDNISYQAGGQMAPFGTGKYELAFETAAFALQHDGDFTKPVLTAFGYHIIKRLGKELVSATNNKETAEMLKQKITEDPRIAYSKKMLLQKILQQEHYKKAALNETNLWAYSDSFILRKQLPNLSGITEQTTLFSFDQKKFTVSEWLNYLKSVKQPNDKRTYNEWYETYLQLVAFNYYRDHLETYNKEFAYQVNDFKEGNLLFEIMQRKIWDKASADSAGLKNYFELHHDKYWWQPSAEAVMFTCSNEKSASDLQKKIQQQGISSWRMLVDSSAGLAQADSGRFELTQLPMTDQQKDNSGMFSSMVTNATDNTVTFAYTIKTYTNKAPRNYADARGFVISDYQASLEDEWIARLKKKYPVKIDEAVFNSLQSPEVGKGRKPGS